MANLFTFWDNGTWEGVPTDTSNQNYNHSSGVVLARTTSLFRSGAAGGVIVTPSNATNPTILGDIMQDRANGAFNKRVIPLTIGLRYKLSCWVMVSSLPNYTPLGSNDLPIVFAPFFTRPNQVNDIHTPVLVGNCIDTWQKVSYEFTYDGSDAFKFIQLRALKAGDQNQSYGVTPAGTQNIGGVLWVDDFELFEVVVCTIGYDNPAYNKTDETALGANDGTITIHAHTTNAPLQYRIDGGAYQLSNIFTGIAPGVHSIDVIDSSVCTLPPLSVTILAYLAPPPPTGGTLIINEKPLTNYNFVPWFEATSGDTGFDKVDCENHHWDLPKPYDEIRNKKVHAFVVAQNEQFTFYTNFDTPLPSTLDFTKLRLGLARNNGMVNMNLANLQKDVNDDGSYYVYSSPIINTTVPEGDQYFLVIYNIDTFDILYASGRLEVMTKDNADTFTARLQYRHSNLFYNYHFDRLNSLLLQIRMRLANADEQTEGALQQYRAVSSGKLRNVSFDLDKYVKLETYYYDIHGVRGMYSFQAMETIIINDKNYTLKTAYKTTWSSKGLNVHKGSLELYEEEFSTQNKYGNPSTITIIGSDDSLIQADNGYLIKI